MVNLKLLEEDMKKNNVSDKDVAKALNMDVSTWYRRKLAPNQIKIEEVLKLRELIQMSNERAIAIFLN